VPSSNFKKSIPSGVVAFGCAAFLCLLAGCKEPPQIVTQRIPKSQSGLQSLRNEADDTPQAPAAKTTFPVPEGWTRGKANPMFPSDKFLKSFDGDEVVLSIMSLPASNEWQSNVQRWTGQVGLSKSADEIKEMTTEVDVDGIASPKVRLFATEDDGQAIIGIMSVKGNLAWFTKLIGKKSAVNAAEKEFDKYVGSIKLP